MSADNLEPIVDPGSNCWRIERASEASVIVDAADYYKIIGKVMKKAKKRIFIVGWDFDTRIALDPADQSYGASLGHFFIELAREKPDRQIDVLKWSFGALKQFTSVRATWWLVRWWLTKNIHLKFDSAHPTGCSHHQKIVVIDESIAACGGIDIAARRWDTSDHKPNDPCRKTPNGHDYQPWHDVTMMMRGPVAKALGDLGRERWKNATHRDMDEVRDQEDGWPDDLEPMFRDVDIAIARTRAEYGDLDEVRENERLVIDMICAAKKFCYIENQYFTAPRVAAAIAERLQEADPPEFVLVMPKTADGWLESVAMDGTRQKLMQQLQKIDHAGRFKIYVPVNGGGENIYVHAKVAIVDDRFLRVGSSNLNNRSMGLDSECDVVIDCALEANRKAGHAIRDLRHRLIGEHLAIDPAEFARMEHEKGGMIPAIDALCGGGKTLEELEREELSDAEEFIASHEIGDPESTDEMFEPLSRKGLRTRWRETRERVKGWMTT